MLRRRRKRNRAEAQCSRTMHRMLQTSIEGELDVAISRKSETERLSILEVAASNALLLQWVVHYQPLTIHETSQHTGETSTPQYLCPVTDLN